MSPKLESTTPPFLQIANHLRKQISSGKLKPGDALPSEKGLAAEWGVSAPTAGKALAILQADGLTVSRQGSGTRVK